jgi:hypothetical protein
MQAEWKEDQVSCRFEKTRAINRGSGRLEGQGRVPSHGVMGLEWVWWWASVGAGRGCASTLLLAGLHLTEAPEHRTTKPVSEFRFSAKKEKNWRGAGGDERGYWCL